jgi:predicted RND superfamily exporter protein
MLLENKFGKYLLYAVGEIILVVIGILIALQINNNNEERKIKIKELSYLANIKADSHLNLTELKAYILTRERSVNSAETILELFENIENVDPEDFNFHNLNVQIWYPFNKNNNAYQELINSGNLAIISNDSIKNLLINMELNYKQIEFIERHMRQDFESYLYPIYFSITDLQSDITNYTFQVSKGTEGTKAELSKDKMELLLKNQTFKNGFVLSIFSNNRLILDYKKMILMTEKLLSSIDSELAENK